MLPRSQFCNKKNSVNNRHLCGLCWFLGRSTSLPRSLASSYSLLSGWNQKVRHSWHWVAIVPCAHPSAQHHSLAPVESFNSIYSSKKKTDERHLRGDLEWHAVSFPFFSLNESADFLRQYLWCRLRLRRRPIVGGLHSGYLVCRPFFWKILSLVSLNGRTACSRPRLSITWFDYNWISRVVLSAAFQKGWRFSAARMANQFEQ